jgi:hypothetical protein
MDLIIKPEFEKNIMLSNITNTILSTLAPQRAFWFFSTSEKVEVIKEIYPHVYKRLMDFIEAFYNDVSNTYHFQKTVDSSYEDPEKTKILEETRLNCQKELAHAIQAEKFLE